MNEERDKFLTEAMGICYWVDHDCARCEHTGIPRRPGYIRFSTWNNFGELVVWARVQPWYKDFLSRTKFSSSLGQYSEGLIDPNRFADEVWRYLENYD